MDRRFKARYLKLVQDALYHAGLCLYTKDKKTVWYSLRSFVFPFMMVDSFISIIMHGVDFYLNLDNLLNICEIVMLTFLHIKCLMSAGCLISRKKEIAVLVKEFDDMYARVEETHPAAPVVIRTMKWMKRLLVGFPVTYCGLIVVLLSAMLYFVTPLREPYFRLWYPYDATAYPLYELTMLYHSIQYLLVGVVLAAADGLFLIMLLHVWTQFVMLNHSLRDIRQNSAKKYEPRIPNISAIMRQKNTVSVRHTGYSCSNVLATHVAVNIENNSSPTQIRVNNINNVLTTQCRVNTEYNSAHTPSRINTDNNSTLCETRLDLEDSDDIGSRVAGKLIDRSVSMSQQEKRIFFPYRVTSADTKKANLMTQKHRFFLNDDRELQINVDMQKNLHAYVKWHQQLIRSVGKIEDVFNPMLVTQLVMNLIAVVAITLYVHLIPAFDLKALTVVMVMMVILSELWAFCWLSEKITFQSCDVKESVFGCDWLESSKSFKQDMRIIISRANQPVHVTAAGVVPLTMTLFHDVTNNAYSFFNLLQSMT